MLNLINVKILLNDVVWRFNTQIGDKLRVQPRQECSSQLQATFLFHHLKSRKIKAAWTSSHKIKAGQDEEVSAENFQGHGYYCAITRLVYMIYVYD